MAEFNSYDKARHRVFSRYHLLKTVCGTPGWEGQHLGSFICTGGEPTSLLVYVRSSQPVRCEQARFLYLRLQIYHPISVPSFGDCQSEVYTPGMQVKFEDMLGRTCYVALTWRGAKQKEGGISKGCLFVFLTSGRQSCSVEEGENKSG